MTVEGNSETVCYILCRCLALPAALLIFVTQAFFLAAMDPMTPLLAASLAGVANLLGDIWLVCGMGWGIAGASLATALAQARHFPSISNCIARYKKASCTTLQSCILPANAESYMLHVSLSIT